MGASGFGRLGMTLALHGHIELPPHVAGGFDHGDVHLASGRVFIAHTANATVDIVDGERLAYEASVGGCAEASGVLCAQDDGGLVFAAARGRARCWSSTRPRALSCARSPSVRSRTGSPGTPGAAPRGGRRRGADCPPRGRRNRRVAGMRRSARSAALVRLRSGARPVPGQYPGPGVRGSAGSRHAGGARSHARLGVGPARAGPRPQPRPSLHRVRCGRRGCPRPGNRARAGSRPDRGRACVAWYSAAHDRLYVAVGQPGVVDVIDCRRLVLADRVTTEPGAHTTAYDRRRQRLYVFLPGSCRAVIFVETHAA